MTVVAATKYVSLEEMAALVEAGVEVVGENRAQDLVRKHDRYADAFRWHYIGHLQSNKVKHVTERCELVHSLDSDSAAKRLTIPALLEVDLGGEETKAGVPVSEIAGFLERNPSGGIHHLCYEVPDIKEARDRLVAQGARVLGQGEPKIGAHGKPVLFLHPKDFCGTLLELEEA